MSYWLAVRPLFSARHGRQELDGVVLKMPDDTWHSRHRFGTALLLMIDDLLPENGIDRCRCRQGVTDDPIIWSDPNSVTRVCVCVQRITQEDGLCDECRVWCVVTDGKNLFQSTTMQPAEIGRAATRGYKET